MQIVSLPQSKKSTSLSKRSPEKRVEPLAVLPVFFALKNKRVIIAGGTEAARWKAELLAASGAHVDVICPKSELTEEMSTLLCDGASDGTLTHIDGNWSAVDFVGAALAIGDIETDDAPRFIAHCKAAAIPANIIDKPEFCEFQFGSIVNRSPVVVSISTTGAAPILGQAVRRKIETLLPNSLGDWGKLAQRVRQYTMSKLSPGVERRAFWEKFTEKALNGLKPPSACDATKEMAFIQRIATKRQSQGHVTLVGAGPGDAELLTMKAIRALQSADVILFDDLVSTEVLELARREAKRMLVGKRGGRESCKQEDINAMMLKFALQGKHVVRLKSGDPTVFGRAGEEITALQDKGIAVQIVPGISTGIALASRLGVSLTHRDFSQSVRFVTAHSRAGKLPQNLDWQSLADPSCTNIYYMCRRTLVELVDTLVANGIPHATPVVLATSLSRNEEKIWRGPLQHLTEAAKEFDINAPTILAIGNALKATKAQNQKVETRSLSSQNLKTMTVGG